MENKDKKIYSYSRLESYHNCPFGYYITYIEKNRGEDNIYSFMGSVTHEILEELQQRLINNEEAIERFDDAITEADMLGYEWMSDSVKDKYITAIKHYFENYKPIECDEYFIEEYFEIPVGDKWMKGYIDLYTKSGKIRRIFIPKRLRNKAIDYYASINRTEGYLFLNKDGKQITTRGIAHQLKALGEKYKMNLNVIYPHSFRHRFAKNFLEKRKDIALLADLMGHESIETTRIYLRKTSEEQQEIVDKIIDW